VSRSANTLNRHEQGHPSQAADGGVWWAEVADLRERIERRRAAARFERRDATEWSEEGRAVAAGGAPRRTITITGHAAEPPAAVPLRLVERAPADLEPAPWPRRPAEAREAPAPHPAARRRPRRTAAEWLGAKPDRVAAWAVALGFLLVLAGILSAH